MPKITPEEFAIGEIRERLMSTIGIDGTATFIHDYCGKKEPSVARYVAGQWIVNSKECDTAYEAAREILILTACCIY